MSPNSLVKRFRTFLLVTANVICVGILAELWLAEHTGSFTQLIPFGLCVLGIGAITAVHFRPRRWTVLALRSVMIGIFLGSLLGIYQHFAHNLGFALEIRPNAVASEVLGIASKGASPLLAPGILALVAVLSLGATYLHPKLELPVLPTDT